MNVKIKTNKLFAILSIITLSIISAFIGAIFMKFLIGECSIDNSKEDIVQTNIINNCEKEKKQINESSELLKECKHKLEECKNNLYNFIKNNNCKNQYAKNISEKKETEKDDKNKDVVIVINSKSIVEPKYINEDKKQYSKTKLKTKQTIKKKKNKKKIKKC